MEFKNLKIAVTGMGVSGISIAKAAKKRGAKPVVYDQQPLNTPAGIKKIDQLESLGIPVVTSWHGHLDEADFDILVTSPGFSKDHPAINDALKAKKPIFSEVEFAYQILKAPLICITGTNGKSTCTVLTWQILKAAGYNAVLCGNISGSGYPEISLTQAADHAKETDVLVSEISSFQLEWIQDFRPKVATITNITPDHLNRYSGFEDYANTKLKLFQNMGHGDTIVINQAEKTVPDIQNSESQKAYFDPTNEHQNNIRIEGDRLIVDDECIDLKELPITSEFQKVNILQSLSLAYAFIGLPSSEQIQKMFIAIKEFKGLDHRMEYLGEKEGKKVFNNSMCTNPKAVLACLQGVQNRMHLLMGGFPKELDYDEVGEFLKNSQHKVYIYTETDPKFKSQLGDHWPVFRSIEEAFRIAVDSSDDGEMISLIPGCASSFPFSNFRERGERFREIAQTWLKAPS